MWFYGLLAGFEGSVCVVEGEVFGFGLIFATSVLFCRFGFRIGGLSGGRGSVSGRCSRFEFIFLSFTSCFFLRALRITFR